MLMQLASSTMKKCSFELEGNAPFIVFDDANIEQAADGLLSGKFRGTGQTCVSPNRVYLQERIHDRLVDAIQKRVAKDMQHKPFDHPEAIMGSLINVAGADKVERLVQDAVTKGATVVMGGRRDSTMGETFYPATVLTGMTNEMEAHNEEIFGPLLAIYHLQTESEVVSIANKSPVGLATYVYTNTLPVAWRLAGSLEVGMTGINTGIVSDPQAPFGGIKESGFGREGGDMEWRNSRLPR